MWLDFTNGTLNCDGCLIKAHKVTSHLDLVELLDELEGFFGLARGNLSLLKDLSHVTLACNDGSIRAHKVLSWPHPSRTEGQLVEEGIVKGIVQVGEGFCCCCICDIK